VLESSTNGGLATAGETGHVEGAADVLGLEVLLALLTVKESIRPDDVLVVGALDVGGNILVALLGLLLDVAGHAHGADAAAEEAFGAGSEGDTLVSNSLEHYRYDLRLRY